MFITQEILMYLSAIRNSDVITCNITIDHAIKIPKGASPILFRKKFPKSLTSFFVKIPCKLCERKIIANASRKINVELNVFIVLF